MKQIDDINQELLLQGLRKGDQYAFSTIFHRYHKSLVYFASKLLKQFSTADSEEIVQDVFVKVYERRTSFKTLDNIKAFLYIATKNACFDKIAKENVRSKRFDAYIQNFVESEDNILQHIIDSELINQLSLEIDALPEKCRDIMRQFFDEGKNSKEIAEDSGITISTVNNQKARAVSILKKRLRSAGMSLLLFYL